MKNLLKTKLYYVWHKAALNSRSPVGRTDSGIVRILKLKILISIFRITIFSSSCKEAEDFYQSEFIYRFQSFEKCSNFNKTHEP